MSSSIGLSAVILGCFGTTWAAARQQVGLLIMLPPDVELMCATGRSLERALP